MKTKKEIKEIVSKIYNAGIVYLENVSDRLLCYVRDLSHNSQLTISYTSCEENQWESQVSIFRRGNDYNIRYISDDDKFVECLAIAEALALIVLDFAPESEGEKYQKGEITYFAQQLLELNAKIDNGFILHEIYNPFASVIISRIHSLRPNYVLNEISKVQKLKIDNLIEKIFTANMESSILYPEIRLITNYFRMKKGVSHKNFHVSVRSTNALVEPKGRASVYEDGVNIFHSSLENVQSYFRNYKNINAVRILRIIIAHQLAHVILHYVIPNELTGKDTNLNSCEMEREAAYFALCLLKQRESLYIGDDDNTYNIACYEWDRLSKLIYQNDELIEWLIDEDSNYVIESNGFLVQNEQNKTPVINQFSLNIDLVTDPFIRHLILACIDLQADFKYINASEDERNKYIGNMLKRDDYIIKDQTKRGCSASGKSSGEIDIFVEKDKFPFTIIEALILKSLNTSYLNTHLNKIFYYDTAGNAFNVCLSYVETKDFGAFWKKYCNHVAKHNYPFPLVSFDTKVGEVECPYTDIRFMTTAHDRNGKITLLYHFCVKIMESPVN